MTQHVLKIVTLSVDQNSQLQRTPEIEDQAIAENARNALSTVTTEHVATQVPNIAA